MSAVKDHRGSMNSRGNLVPLCCYQADCLRSDVVLRNRSLSSLLLIVPSWGIYLTANVMQTLDERSMARTLPWGGGNLSRIL